MMTNIMTPSKTPLPLDSKNGGPGERRPDRLAATSDAANDRSIDIMARTIWGEARGEPRLGQIAVAYTVKNRACRPGWWGRDIISVCQAHDQFSCWRATDPNRPKLLGVTRSDPVFVQIIKIAQKVMAGELPDPTHGATSYHSIDCHPGWANEYRVLARIGRHIFYSDTPANGDMA